MITINHFIHIGGRHWIGLLLRMFRVRKFGVKVWQRVVIQLVIGVAVHVPINKLLGLRRVTDFRCSALACRTGGGS
eukprot:1050194-Amphidinium_carterae.1